jgi:heme-degrading monooxygenase HmoA
MTKQIIEWAPFNLRDGADEAAMLRDAQVLQEEFLAKQPGFLRRELLKDGDSRYIDVLLWASMDQAQAAMSKIMESAACQAYFGHMRQEEAEAGAGVSHFRVLRAF